MSRSEWITLLGYGLALNLIWEVAQAGPFFSMWERTGLVLGVGYIVLATLGDGLAVSAIALLAFWLLGRRRLSPPTALAWGLMAGGGALLGVYLEWQALVWDLWRYNADMPTVSVAGHAIGVAPVAQMILLPAISVYLTLRPDPEEEEEPLLQEAASPQKPSST
jgi:hypothetical protein